MEPERGDQEPTAARRGGGWRLTVLRAPRLGLIVVVMVAAAVGAASVTAHSGSGKPPIILAATLTLSGPNAIEGVESLRGAQLYLDSVNGAGGVGGRRLDLQIYDDKGDPATALRIARQIVGSRAVFVFGNLYSYLGLPPSTVYKANRVPAMTAGISRDDLTVGNPYYFRNHTTSTAEASTSATYSRRILGFDQASIIHASDTAYSVPQAGIFARTFAEDGGHIARSLAIDASTAASLQRSTLQAATATARDPHPGIIFLSMLADPARATIVALRRAGVTAPIVTTDDASSSNFAGSFAGYPEEQRSPGYFTEGLYTPSALLYDSAPDTDQAFAALFRQTYGVAPGWAGALQYASAQVVVAALQGTNVQGSTGSVASDRQAIRDALAAMDAPQSGIYTINGLVYFDDNHNSIVPIRFGRYQRRRLISLPLQFAPIDNPELIDLAAERRAGDIVTFNGHDWWKQRVVYAGLAVNKVSKVDVSRDTFTVDFYLWLRYTGSDDAAALVFPNALVTTAGSASNPGEVVFDPAAPLESGTMDGLHYRLYHITGDFKAEYDFHDFPFDRQDLTIVLQNRVLTRDRLTYVIDAPGLRLRDDNTPDPVSARAAFATLASWRYRSLRYASDTFVTTSTLGKPALFVGQTETDYSGLQVTMAVQRNAAAFLAKRVLPLALLMLIVYATLYCPPSLLKERLTVPVTALLAGAVLLTAITNGLPEIGYAVSLEYAFYTFFLLCLACIVTVLIVDRLAHHKHLLAAGRVDMAMRLLFMLAIGVAIAGYRHAFGARLA